MRGLHLTTDYKPIDRTLLKRLLKFLRPYKKYVILAVSLAIATTALSPARPYLTKVAVDTYIANKDWTGLINIAAIILGLLVVHGLLQYGLTYLMQWVGQHILCDIRIKLYNHIQSLALRFYDKNPVGRLVTRVTNDVEVLNKLFSSGVVMIIADFLLLFWLIGFMFYTSVELALLTLTILPFLIAFSYYFRKKVRVLFRDIRLQLAKINSFLNEFISGIATVKIFSQEKNQNRKFDELNSEYKRLQVNTIFYYAMFFPVVEMLSAAALGLILWYTAGNILSGEITVGIMIAFTQYAEMFFRPVRDLSEKYTTLQSAMASSERIFEMLDTDDKINEQENAEDIGEFKDKIEFRDVSFSYDGEKQALKNVSFDVKKGETAALVGATGSGKTTIINLLSRFYDFDDGRITIDGKDICNISSKSMRDKLAVVLQDVFLFSRSISDNISLGEDKIDIDKIRYAAKELGAEGFIENLPDNFEHVLTERGSTLSAGQRQLIAFCRAYAADPEILILDEASSNIDSETELVIEKALEKLLKDRTSIVIAHRLSTIKRADKIIVLHHGEVREIGTHSELLNNGGIYSRLYNLQYKQAV